MIPVHFTLYLYLPKKNLSYLFIVVIMLNALLQN